MARGFNTLGVADTDIITARSILPYSLERTWFAWLYRIDAGPGAEGQFINARDGSEVVFSLDPPDGYSYRAGFDTTDGVWGAGGGGPTYTKGRAWQAVFVSYSGASVSNLPRIFIDGTPCSISQFVAPVGSYRTTEDAVTLGNRATLDKVVNGMIAEVAAWNRLLSDAEARKLAQGTRPSAFPNGLVDYWPLHRDLVSRVTGVSGTVTGTKVQAHPRGVRPSRLRVFRSVAAAAAPRRFLLH